MERCTRQAWTALLFRYVLPLIVLGLSALVLGHWPPLQGWLARTSGDVLVERILYQQSLAVQGDQGSLESRLVYIWDPVELEAAGAAQEFVDTRGFSQLHLVVDATDENVHFTVYIDDPQTFG